MEMKQEHDDSDTDCEETTIDDEASFEDAEEDNAIDGNDDTNPPDVAETIHDKHSDSHTILDFLKTEPEREPVPIIHDKSSDNKKSDDKGDLAKPEEDKIKNCAQSVINIIEKLPEIKSKLRVEENNKFKCIFCGNELQSRYRMMAHLDSHVKILQQPLHKCDLCDVMLPQSCISPHRQLHVQTNLPVPAVMACVKRDIRDDLAFCLIHDVNKKQPVKCRYCGLDFNSIEYYKRHFVAQHTVKYVCQLCGESLHTFLQMFKHVKRHKEEKVTGAFSSHPAAWTSGLGKNEAAADTAATSFLPSSEEKDVNIPCSYCEKSFSSQEVLVAHVTDEHLDTNFLKFQCTHCNKSFISNSALKSHIQTHQQVFVCDFEGCTKKYFDKNRLSEHVKSHSTEGRQRALCPQCGQVFSCNQRLLEHIDFKHNGREPLRCDKCNKTFICRQAHKRHMQVHTNTEYNFVCEQCGARFNTSHTFSHHKRKHRDKKDHRCLRCNASFTKMESLEIHLVNNRHFSDKQPESLIKYKSCKHCGKVVTNSRQLSRHIDRAHAKPKTCLYCGKQFNDRSNLLQHMKSHTNTQPRCKICNTLFRSKVRLDKHMDSEHPGMRGRVERPQNTQQQPYVRPSFTASRVTEAVAGVSDCLVDQLQQQRVDHLQEQRRKEVEALAASSNLIAEAERFHDMANVALTLSRL